MKKNKTHEVTKEKSGLKSSPKGFKLNEQYRQEALKVFDKIQNQPLASSPDQEKMNKAFRHYYHDLQQRSARVSEKERELLAEKIKLKDKEMELMKVNATQEFFSSYADAAAYAHKTPRTIQNWKTNGLIQVDQHGRHISIRRSELDRWSKRPKDKKT